jgi:4'-phosphopantetheinyl transferase EntD
MVAPDVTPIESAPEVSDLFPDGRVEVRRVIAHAGHREALFPEELDATLEMAPRRLDEFASARAAAHDALRSLGSVTAVPRGEQRQPVWPTGITGAITHTRGHCMAAVALRSTPGESGEFVIGLDAEERERVSPRVARRILVDAEKQRLELVADPEERQRLVSATFGLKEAFYKAHHQLEERYLGFDVIEVELDDNGLASFTSTGAELSVDPGSEVSGRVTEIDGRMIAAVWIQRTVRSTSHPSRIPSAP